jgi:hypothetical protein
LTSIQAILIACLLVGAILTSIAFRAQILYRLLAVLLFSMATIFVLFPGVTTAIAHSLGVGRGTDLLFYVSLIGGVHAILLLYLRTRELERRITAQIRAMALRDVQHTAGL